ncbi:hypothetical protein BC833DRAFT_585677 [Globomyces pollinis-pini]|nr:hypothetical protein BC833DRAFT_585677 [Globomyces pollinis-pini]
MSFNADQLAQISNTARFSSTLGLIGVLGVAVSYYKYPGEFKTPMGRLILAMSVADLIDASSKFAGRWTMASGVASLGCQAQGALIQMGTLSAIFLSFVMAATVVMVITAKTHFSITRNYELVAVACCFLIPVPMSVIPLMLKSPDGTPLIGDSSQWCWIKGGPTFPQQLMFFFVPFWAVFLFNVIALLLVWGKINDLNKNIRNPHDRKKSFYVVKRMVAYLVAFLFAWTASTVNRMSTFYFGYSLFPFAILQALCSPARGFFNFLAFVYCQRTNPANLLSNSSQTGKSRTGISKLGSSVNIFKSENA